MLAYISQKVDHVHILVKLDVVDMGEVFEVVKVVIRCLLEVRRYVVLQRHELSLELLDILAHSLLCHDISLCSPPTRIANQTCSSSKQNYWRKPSQSEMVEVDEAHEIAKMDGVCSRIESDVYRWVWFEHGLGALRFQSFVARVVK